MSNDFAIGPAGLPVGLGAPISKKPIYLITLEPVGPKTKSLERFITLDKPELLQGFVQVKGFFHEGSDEEITKNITDILTTSKKELYIEIMLPCHRICSMKSLMYKAK